MATETRFIEQNITTAIYWARKAAQELKQGEFAACASCLRHAAESMEKADKESIREYYRNDMTELSQDTLGEILKRASQAAKNELANEN